MSWSKRFINKINVGVLGVCELDNSRAIDEGNIQLSRNKSVIRNRQYSTSHFATVRKCLEIEKNSFLPCAGEVVS